jgi:hypothetical protein
MGIFYGYMPHFQGIFEQAREIFGVTLENLLKNSFYFSEPWSFR